MNISDKIDLTINENRFIWQNIAEYMENRPVAQQHQLRIKQLAFASQYAMTQLSRCPEQIESLLQLTDFSLDKHIIPPEQSQDSNNETEKQFLRQYRHRKLVEIIFLDIVLKTPTSSILRHLSDLADQLIVCALTLANQRLAKKHGQPIDEQGNPLALNIIAMGKLGGRELNFSSDIDLICCYANDGELSGFGKLSYQEYFSRLVKLLAQLLSESTADGFVYRVDLRLRPWGESGPTALSHAAFEHYYQLHGREWEQYAMVKARLLSGSSADQEYLRSVLKSFVYRKYHDHRVFHGLAELKDKIDLQASSRGMLNNIKVGKGGIREIEFYTQAFQILKGGRNHQLQTSEIQKCLDVLQKQKIAEDETIQQLRAAYLFLRELENRIQMFNDEQTHQLPADKKIQDRVMLSFGYSSWQELLTELESHRKLVGQYFDELFQRDKSEAPTYIVDDGFADQEGNPQQLEFIRASGVSDSDNINQQLTAFLTSKAWKFMSARARLRFNNLLPELLSALGLSEEQNQLFERLLKLFASIAGRSVYFELLHQNPVLLKKLVLLFNQSAWIANEVSQYPMLLETLLQNDDEDQFNRQALAQRLQLQLDNVAADVELELDTLRLFKREYTLLVASAELSGEINATKASLYLSELAEVMLGAVYNLASLALQQKHGTPEFDLAGKRCIAGLAIVGYGKLGGQEMHYQSDLDVIFLHNSEGENQLTNGLKGIDNLSYFARLAQKIISTISVLTASGKLYEVDPRLRPDGSSGLLVSSVQAYHRYQLDKAWTWEHQALVRARLLAGDTRLAPDFDTTRATTLQQKRDPSELKKQVTEMREKVFQSQQPPKDGFSNLKHSRGAMIDIEFMVQYWVLLHANSIGSICSYSDNISLLNELFRLDLITSSQSQLVEIYQTYHRLLHESVLQNRSDEIDAELIKTEITHVINCWNECFGLQEK